MKVLVTGHCGYIVSVMVPVLMRDGHELVFAFLANDIGNPDYVHAVEANQMAVALAKYNG